MTRSCTLKGMQIQTWLKGVNRPNCDKAGVQTLPDVSRRLCKEYTVGHQAMGSTSWLLTLFAANKNTAEKVYAAGCQSCEPLYPEAAQYCNHEQGAYTGSTVSNMRCAMTDLPAPLLLPRPSKIPPRLCPGLQPAASTHPWSRIPHLGSPSTPMPGYGDALCKSISR